MKINFLNEELEIIQSRKCPICNKLNNKKFADLINCEDIFNNSYSENSLIRCSNCYTVYFCKLEIVGYLDAQQEIAKKYTDHYLLIGCGIDLGIELLDTWGGEYETLLEVGCGVGFSLDYWSNFKNKYGIGLEAAYYGSVGRKLLNVDIRDIYLNSENPPLGKFDIVLATEVIEHVENPSGFLKSLKNNMSENGILLLTTPAAEFINRDKKETMLLAVLSYGFHYFILSKKSMTKLLIENGFTNIEINIRNERMIVKAELKNNNKFHLFKKKFSRKEYINYLEYLAINPNKIVIELSLIRLFEELMNAGDFEKAADVLPKLFLSIKEKYRLDITNLISSIDNSKNFIQLDDYLYNLPPYIGILFYYLGIFYSRSQNHLINKLLCFGFAYQLLSLIVIVDKQNAQKSESLITLAGSEYINAIIDNLNYFFGYGSRKNSGLNNDFISYENSLKFKKKIIDIKSKFEPKNSIINSFCKFFKK